MSLVDSRGREKLVDYRRVMEILGVGKTKAYELMHSGELGAIYKVGSSLRVLDINIQKYIDQIKTLTRY